MIVNCIGVCVCLLQCASSAHHSALKRASPNHIPISAQQHHDVWSSLWSPPVSLLRRISLQLHRVQQATHHCTQSTYAVTQDIEIRNFRAQTIDTPSSKRSSLDNLTQTMLKLGSIYPDPRSNWLNLPLVGHILWRNSDIYLWHGCS